MFLVVLGVDNVDSEEEDNIFGKCVIMSFFNCFNLRLQYILYFILSLQFFVIVRIFLSIINTFLILKFAILVYSVECNYWTIIKQVNWQNLQKHFLSTR